MRFTIKPESGVDEAIVAAYSETRQKHAGKQKVIFEEDMIYVWLDLFRSFCLSRGVLQPAEADWADFFALEEKRIARVEAWAAGKRNGNAGAKLEGA
eukprot:g13830.t1